ncbi:Protein serine/threonine phosphatase PrpC, regulation of stationary phase [Enhygromyxa salina]|uniref:Protein serine/threonine phosphatase PrpC, regulation of stationary phase n=1 Tax=Enhygromyxa salina TaxID=215803 RepID=A0A0C2D4X7_9BACT|nr:protein phosphatase 2C domain-containing protein [Enhygromyxa salina]KIG16735.1 Protein serine/threonine phosphatase PrpC, regulation of stationary phase [Enhygromyxa salina]
MYKLFKRTHHAGTFEIQMAGACDPGRARDHNEDAIAIQEDDGRGYYVALVCDGMGGHNAGEVASALAVEAILGYLEQHFGKVDNEALLSQAFHVASEAIDEHAIANPDAQGLGCTCVMIMGIRDRIWVAWAGDSRAYAVTEEGIFQLSTDHTVVQELVDQQLITPEQAAVHPYRGRISRCLGHGKKKGAPTIREFEFPLGTNLMVCSDGLSDVLRIDEIEALVGQRDVRSSARRLIEAANGAGGPDNISAVIMRRVV